MRLPHLSRRALAGALALSLLAAACPRDGADAPEKDAAKATDVEAEAPAEATDERREALVEKLRAAEVEVPPGGAIAADAEPGEAHADCVAAIEEGAPETRTFEEWSVTVAGYRAELERSDEAASEELTLGVLGDVNEASDENLYNLGRLIAWFQSEDVDAVVVVGDSAESEAGLVRVLATLAEPGWPVLPIIGNREGRAMYRGAVDAVQAHYPGLVDLGRRRLVQLPGAALVSLPGYHDPRFLHEDDGCLYFEENVAELIPLVREEAEGPVFLVSHSGPRGGTEEAIDYSRDAENIGDGSINRLAHVTDLAFGLHAHVREAGGRATTLAGGTQIEEGTYVSSLFLNAGPADSSRWVMNDGTESTGMGAVVSIRGSEAAYRVERLDPIDEAQRVEAKALRETLEARLAAQLDLD